MTREPKGNRFPDSPPVQAVLLMKASPHLRVFMAGCLVSFLGALPFGMLNMTAFHIAAAQDIPGALWFSVAAVMVELIAAALCLAGLNRIQAGPKLMKYALPLALALLLYLSLSSFLGKAAFGPGTAAFPLIGSPFLLGLALSASNPLQFPFWAGWIGVLMARGLLTPRMHTRFAFLGGIGIGSLAGFAVFIMAGIAFVDLYASLGRYISIGMGCLYLLFAFYLSYRYYQARQPVRTH